MRPFGFYRVKHQNSWTVAEKTADFDSELLWYIVGSAAPFLESDFEEIGDKLEWSSLGTGTITDNDDLTKYLNDRVSKDK